VSEKRNGGQERDDLAEVLRRRGLTEGAARPDAVEKRHAAGHRGAVPPVRAAHRFVDTS